MHELKKEESSWSRQKGALATCHKVAMSPASAIMPPDIFGHLTGSRFILVIRMHVVVVLQAFRNKLALDG